MWLVSIQPTRVKHEKYTCPIKNPTEGAENLLEERGRKLYISHNLLGRSYRKFYICDSHNLSYNVFSAFLLYNALQPMVSVVPGHNASDFWLVFHDHLVKLPNLCVQQNFFRRSIVIDKLNGRRVNVTKQGHCFGL